MKNIFTLAFAFFFTGSLFAQAPEKMSYQAVVRDGSNELVINQSVGMQISILQGAVSGTSVYTETQTPITNSNGLVSLQIGSGTSVSGPFSAIDWSAGPYFIKTETDPNGGTNYTITGTSQLMSVPYALYAKTSGNGEGPQGPAGVDGNDGATGATGPQGPVGADGDDGAQGPKGDIGATGPSGSQGLKGDAGSTGSQGLKGDKGDDGQGGITNGGTNVTINGSGTSVAPYVVNATFTEVDGSLTNEIQDLQLSGNNLTITKNGTATTIDLSSYLDDTDTQLNEVEVDAFTANNGYLTAFTEVDGSTTNELQTLSISNDTIYLTDGNFAKIPVGFSGSYTDLNNKPDLSVYSTTDTTLEESEVDAMVANNGYLTTFTEVDGSITNEIQQLSVSGSGDTLYLQHAAYVIIPGISLANVPVINDADGNFYTTVTIGTQEWMSENLRTTKYSDGTAIPNVTDDTQWNSLSTGAWCSHNNSSSNDVTYGKLYNWYAVNTSKLCPTGWHVPTDAEWTVLTDYLTANGHSGAEGNALKATSGWNSGGNGTDDFGFLGLPGGHRNYDGNFYGIGTDVGWWSSSQYDAFNAWYRFLYYGYTSFSSYDYYKKSGFSVRCLRD